LREPDTIARYREIAQLQNALRKEAELEAGAQN
jgi:hypothetical protein